jgi:hypothetical protein
MTTTKYKYAICLTNCNQWQQPVYYIVGETIAKVLQQFIYSIKRYGVDKEIEKYPVTVRLTRDSKEVALVSDISEARVATAAIKLLERM